MTIEMSRYYANNYGNLRTVFGYYDEDKKDFCAAEYPFRIRVSNGAANVCSEPVDCRSFVQ